MPAYSLDLRTRVVASYRQPGARQAAVAARFGVSVSFLKKLLRHERQTGSLAPKIASGGRLRYLDAEAQAWLVAYVAQQPDATLAGATGGQRVGQAVPLKGGPSLTLIGTLSPQGLGAVQLFEGTLNYERFALYVSQFLAPTLRAGDVLVLDNLAVHKIGGLREWLAERGVRVLFLPPYSPDFSPIEQARSKLKTALRTVQARSRQALDV